MQNRLIPTMSERWKTQLGNGMLLGLTYISINLLFAAFPESKEEELTYILSHPDFYLKSALCFLIGTYILGYAKWRFPKKTRLNIDENRNEKQSKRKINKEMRNYIINNVATLGSVLVLANLDSFSSHFKWQKALLLTILILVGGSISGYHEWRKNSIDKQ